MTRRHTYRPVASRALAPAATVAAFIAAVGASVASEPTTPANPTSETDMSQTTDEQSAPLKRELDDLRERFNDRADDHTKRVYDAGVAAVKASGIEQTAKQVGDKAPQFILPDAVGNEVSLDELLAEGPVVLTWYRGGWCPYCNIQLRAYQQILPQIRSLGASLAAVSPETPDNSLDTAQKNELEFAVLSDKGHTVASKFGLTYTLESDVAEIYSKHFDLLAFNGDDSNQLPVSATYVIDQDRTIRFAFIDADYRNRAEPSDVVEALRSIATEQ
ncbi:MAG: peroxiredoxin-like family protein [Planctomycetota bacterium]